MLYWFIRFPNNRLFYKVPYKMQTKDKQQSVYDAWSDFRYIRRTNTNNMYYK